MVCEVFGLPGSGKSSLVAYMAISEQNKIFRGKSVYKRIYSNVKVEYPGIIYMTFSDMLTYDLGWNSLCLIDEATLEFDNRDYKSFDYAKKDFFLQHRRRKIDIWLFLQQWDALDRKIRCITDEVYYIHKGAFFKSISYMNKIPYGIMIPSKKDSDSEKYGEIIQGYHRGGFFSRMFCKRFYRPLVYGYYDSFMHDSGKEGIAKWIGKHVKDPFFRSLLTPEDQTIETVTSSGSPVVVRTGSNASSSAETEPFLSDFPEKVSPLHSMLLWIRQKIERK